MTFRVKLAIAFLLCTLVPLLVLGAFVQRETRSRVTDQYEERVQSLASAVVASLSADNIETDRALQQVAALVSDDNSLRSALQAAAPTSRAVVIDFAGDAMRRVNLDALDFLDVDGQILSSGQFRNDFGREDGARAAFCSSRVAQQVDDGSVVTVARLRRPDAPFLALAQCRSLEISGRQYFLLGGREIDSAYLSRLSSDPSLTVSLAGLPWSSPAQATGEPATLVGFRYPVDVVDTVGKNRGAADARIEVTQSASPLEALIADVNRWFVWALGLSGLAALVVSIWIAMRLGKPIVELARKTEHVNMERLNESFRSDRTDEIGLLSRKLGEMTRRLRVSAGAIRDAERRATVGDVARQVNHDVRNGLTPIRNVVRHLSELADDDPTALAEVFADRRGTLESSVEYLDDLANRYARLTRDSVRQPCDLSDTVRRVAADLELEAPGRIRTSTTAGTIVLGDPISMRRLVENLVRNGLQSGSQEQPATVLVSTGLSSHTDANAHAEGAPSIVTLTVADDGAGMTEETQRRIFDDFYTTKPNGSGLGLSIVRRITMDLQGTIRVESAQDEGSVFTLELPLCR